MQIHGDPCSGRAPRASRGDLGLAENGQRAAITLSLLFRGLGFLLLVGTRNPNHGVDAMTDTCLAVMPAVTRNRDGPDPIDLDRLAARLDHLGLCWGEPDTVGDSSGR
jgi:hypothetical protein